MNHQRQALSAISIPLKNPDLLLSFSTVARYFQASGEHAPDAQRPRGEATVSRTHGRFIRALFVSISKQRFLKVFSTRDGRQPDGVDTAGLERRPRQSTEEPPDVAGGADQVVLEPHLGIAAITSLA